MHISWQALCFVDLEVQISWQVQYFVGLEAQISWQVQCFVGLEAQISWQAQYFVDLEVQISWQAPYFVDLEVQISWQAQYWIFPSLNPHPPQSTTISTVTTNHHHHHHHHHHCHDLHLHLSTPACVFLSSPHSAGWTSIGWSYVASSQSHRMGPFSTSLPGSLAARAARGNSRRSTQRSRQPKCSQDRRQKRAQGSGGPSKPKRRRASRWKRCHAGQESGCGRQRKSSCEVGDGGPKSIDSSVQFVAHSI